MFCLASISDFEKDTEDTEDKENISPMLLHIRYDQFCNCPEPYFQIGTLSQYLKKNGKIWIFVTEGDDNEKKVHYHIIYEGTLYATKQFMYRTCKALMKEFLSSWDRYDKQGKPITKGMYSCVPVKQIDSLVRYVCKGPKEQKGVLPKVLIIHPEFTEKYGSTEHLHNEWHDTHEKIEHVSHVSEKRKKAVDGWTEEVLSAVPDGLDSPINIGAAILDVYHKKQKLFPNKYYLETLIQTKLYRDNEKKDPIDKLSSHEMFARLYPQIAQHLA